MCVCECVYRHGAHPVTGEVSAEEGFGKLQGCSLSIEFRGLEWGEEARIEEDQCVCVMLLTNTGLKHNPATNCVFTLNRN